MSPWGSKFCRIVFCVTDGIANVLPFSYSLRCIQLFKPWPGWQVFLGNIINKSKKLRLALWPNKPPLWDFEGWRLRPHPLILKYCLHLRIGQITTSSFHPRARTLEHGVTLVNNCWSCSLLWFRLSIKVVKVLLSPVKCCWVISLNNLAPWEWFASLPDVFNESMVVWICCCKFWSLSTSTALFISARSGIKASSTSRASWSDVRSAACID